MVTVKGHVDKETCISCGLCPDICPEIFSMDDDGKAIALDNEIPDELVESAKEAEELCPVEAITVE